jgi:murein DD-endopeptidase MepM/ murein hydrolase activator NlpD
LTDHKPECCRRGPYAGISIRCRFTVRFEHVLREPLLRGSRNTLRSLHVHARGRAFIAGEGALMSFVLRAGSRLSNGSVRFVTRHAAVTAAAVAASAAALLAFAAGVATGVHLPAHGNADDPLLNRVERDYAIDQLGKLNASIAQIEPRIARLTAQVGALRDFEARLKTPRAMSRIPVVPAASDTSATDGEGGPLLPPHACAESAGVNAAGTASVDSPLTQQQLDCINATLSALEQQTAAHAVAYAAFPARMPAEGARFGSPFGNRIDPFTHRLSFHPGIDLVAKTGTPIFAAAGGRVIFAGPKSGYGNAVEIDHGNGLVTRYGHASRILVHEDELVLPREHVADVGSTGRSTGPHLHFEVLLGGTNRIDPAPWLAQRGLSVGPYVG